MGLITTYGAANRVIDTDLMVTYNKRRIYGDWTHVVGAGTDHYYEAWEYIRRATKTYRYVGMDYNTAKNCATAMVTKYTRTQKNSIWDQYNNAEFGEAATGSSILMADIAIQHNDGCMYSVVVSVNEEDARARIASLDPANLFTAENDRDYDTGAQA